MKHMSGLMLGLLERLAEMFPKQHYKSELDRYISSKYPTNAADVEHWTKEYQHRHSNGGLV